MDREIASLYRAERSRGVGSRWRDESMFNPSSEANYIVEVAERVGL